ncbi:TIGR04211 family SH3 domain-containing protein [Celerinatantimonas yamalensis]|uniref:TIGR04211 family SH3 domain-containing protein n=1 Tax=Celerinatantimonas yamalensis TaxID=559956 RepID=A0ABW9GA57_9GAMM
MRYKLLLSVLVTGLSFSAFAAQRYVTNDLFIYMHSGPGNNYRIVGTANAGEKVNELEFDKDSQFAHIKLLDSGKDGWIAADKLSSTPSVQTRLEQSQQQLQSTQQKLKTLETASQQGANSSAKEIEQLKQQLAAEKNQTTQLTSKLSNLLVSNKKLSSQLSNIQQNVQMQWLLRGGLIAVVGLIIGLVVPYLPRRRKRNADRWM